MIPRALERFVAMMSQTNPSAATGDVLAFTADEQLDCPLTRDSRVNTSNRRIIDDEVVSGDGEEFSW
jgi:hypothetical protein